MVIGNPYGLLLAVGVC